MTNSSLSLRLSLLAATLTTALVACATEPTLGTANRPIIETPCAADADCPTGFQCELEEEHGVVASYCQADEDSDGSCPAGLELEIEHGQAYCKPHGGDDGTDGGPADGGDDGAGSGSGSGSGSDNNAGSTGTGTTGATCASDADCAVGYECELEPGAAAGACKAHGG